jgi:hypothetical protein
MVSTVPTIIFKDRFSNDETYVITIVRLKTKRSDLRSQYYTEKVTKFLRRLLLCQVIHCNLTFLSKRQQKL